MIENFLSRFSTIRKFSNNRSVDCVFQCSNWVDLSDFNKSFEVSKIDPLPFGMDLSY